MNEKRAKIIRRVCKQYDLPRSMYQRIKKVVKNYRLDITQTLGLIDRAAGSYYENMAKVNKLLEKELNNGSTHVPDSQREDNADSNQ